MRFSDVIVAVVLGGWGLCTLLVHTPRFKLLIRRRDHCALVPEWNFFAPRPAKGDYIILFRDYTASGAVQPWTELPVASPRGWWNSFWNPHRRPRKALFDAVTELALHVKEKDETIVASVPYLTLLNFISNLPRTIPVVRTQFLIMTTDGAGPGGDPLPLFLSSPHDL